MNIILIPLLQAINGILSFYQLIIFVSIVLTWLIMFGIIDIYKYRVLNNIFVFTRIVTEPLYAFVKRFIPTLGPLDFSPVMVVLAIYIISEIINHIIYKLSVVY